VEIRALETAEPFATADGSAIRELLGLPTAAVRNQSLAEATLEPGQATQRHYHRESEEIYFLLEGTGEMELDGERALVSPGDAILIPPGRLAPDPRLGRRASPSPLLLRASIQARGHVLPLRPR
jgi:quercetin dioxygenase-like cupin family protein